MFLLQLKLFECHASVCQWCRQRSFSLITLVSQTALYMHNPTRSCHELSEMHTAVRHMLPVTLSTLCSPTVILLLL